MTNQFTHNADTAQTEDIVALWRQSIGGNGDARQALLQRIMPASALPKTTVILSFAAPRPAPIREAA